MCIRDRLKTIIADVRDAERMTRILAEERPHAVFHAAAHKHVSVSYTHLRDHETVLAIVCRLLPEKKHTHTRMDALHIRLIAREWLTHVGAARQVGRGPLAGPGAFKPDVAREVHNPHSAAADFAFERKPAGDE